MLAGRAGDCTSSGEELSRQVGKRRRSSIAVRRRCFTLSAKFASLKRVDASWLFSSVRSCARKVSCSISGHVRLQEVGLRAKHTGKVHEGANVLHDCRHVAVAAAKQHASLRSQESLARKHLKPNGCMKMPDIGFHS